MTSVVAIGVFDGVHLGHQALVVKCLEVSKELNLDSVVLTFDPHPMAVVRGLQVDALSSVGRRTQILKQLGISDVEVLEFNSELSSLSPADFINQVLQQQLDAKHIVVGAGFRFGKNAQGTISELEAAGLTVHEVGHVLFEKERVSSTRIRHSLSEGNLEIANAMLTRAHRIEGEVIYGQQRGRELGFPTANIAPSFRQAIPADGVYAGWLTEISSGQVWPAAISIGTNPTFTDIETRSIEAYAIDQTRLDLYGKTVAVDFVQFLRPMWAFNGLDELIAAIEADVTNSRKALAL
ncbi:MAG: hypothetical protein RLZZ330_246 [Actinomycetota bacterium]|jgi:riboflavin kinase/FMN adenylyltransferase